MEHQQQFRGGQPARIGEEAAGEHLEGQVVRRFGEAHALQERGGGDAVEAFVHLGHAHVEERQGGPRVHRGEVAPSEGGAEGDESDRAEGRGPRDAGEAVGQATAVPQGVVGQRGEAVQAGVGTAEQSAEVVVLAEEGVEPAGHGHGAAVGQGGAPAGEPAADRVLLLVQRHAGAAFGHEGGRGQTGDPAADHRDGRLVTASESVRTGRGEDDLGLAVAAPSGGGGAADGHRTRSSVVVGPPLRARKVCTMPVCHPATGATRTEVRPARVSRAANSGAVSKATTLRRRWR